MARLKMIGDLSITGTVWLLVRSRVTRRSAFSLLGTVIRDFFFPQFESKLKPSKRPVVRVDHPLDDCIGFNPRHVNTYLTFVHLWLRALLFFYRLYGKAALEDIRDFVRGIEKLYYEAGLVYKKCQSTTNRPLYRKNLRFMVIHTLDPHLHCVPSLHVLIVLFTWARMRDILERHTVPDNEKAVEIKNEAIGYLYGQAVAITESILFVKQHSVNCIPAALYALLYLCDTIGPKECREFINALFHGEHPTLTRKEELIGHMHALFDGFLACDGKMFRDVLLDFLHGYGSSGNTAGIKDNIQGKEDSYV